LYGSWNGDWIIVVVIGCIPHPLLRRESGIECQWIGDLPDYAAHCDWVRILANPFPAKIHYAWCHAVVIDLKLFEKACEILHE